ncbi:hypothetical protein QPK87_38755 [Kamptonema cortianum]|nr:hypothetical protein [Kamptonema cortianum]
MFSRFRELGARKKNASTGKWKVSREARGKISLEHIFKGAGIAGTPDSKNEKRYETWISYIKHPVQMKINDEITLRGPLFAPNQIRFDTNRYRTPGKESTGEWQTGKVGSPILQFDHTQGTFTFESPRIFARTDTYFKREFVAGPKAWTSQKPILNDTYEIEFEMIHGLTQPKEWFKLTGKYVPGQKEVVLTRSFPFTVPLGVDIVGQKLDAKLTLILKPLTE